MPAGAAAAYAVNNSVTVREIAYDKTAVASIQATLKAQGAYLEDFDLPEEIMSHWAYDGVKTLRALGLLDGGYDNNYYLEEPMGKWRYQNMLNGVLNKAGIAHDYIEVNDNVSYVASYKDIRLALVDIQRKMSESISVVMDGRDIGTYVLPNADIKIFQVASVGTRALRRYKENISKGIQCELEDIEIGLKKRDHIDSTRTFAPLKPADDSIVLDTSNLSIEEAVDAVIEIIKKKGYEVKNG